VKAPIRELLASLDREGYVADPAIATALYLAQAMEKPLLVEGDAGVGKTELAKVLARLLGTELIRLQCYEGLDVQAAVYEWNYPRQLLRMRLDEAEGQPGDPAAREAAIFSREYLLERPLLRALTRTEGPPVLLVDEVDRADDAFEAFLLELLSDFQVTVPELGTIRAEHRPRVVLTSNRTRELGDALRRRCLYLYIEHPSFEKEVGIIRRRLPEAGPRLAGEVGRFLQALRRKDLVKPPGVAETLDWTRALLSLEQEGLEPGVVAETLGCLLKDRADFETVDEAALAALVAQARQEGPA
jgi:MoxR-like ATPase